MNLTSLLIYLNWPRFVHGGGTVKNHLAEGLVQQSRAGARESTYLRDSEEARRWTYEGTVLP